MAPAIGRPALDNGSCGSIPGDWVALPPQNIHMTTIQSAERFPFYTVNQETESIIQQLPLRFLLPLYYVLL